uniref:ZMYM2-like/QRICH1 C-terminal domain-containing protein n=1 Tax=Amphimedon queenslandica TaxID=400682 RepID=A0A1X7U6A4_AMPQE
MKRLKADGVGLEKDPISINDEEQLWAKQLLGESSPHVLLDTIVFMCGMYFALRSRKEHRDLKFDLIKVLLIDGKKCIQYTENCYKNNPGGLKHQKIEPKVVTHYENISDPLRCFVKLLEVYYSRCPPPEQRKTDLFYLTPIAKPKGTFWFSAIPVGQNTSKTVSRLRKAAGIEGYKTNYSLRVTTATQLFQAGIDEQVIMNRTGH